MKNILTVAFCFLTMSLFSQVDFQRHTINSNLLSLANPYYRSVTLGYEYRPIKEFGVEITYGMINTDEITLGCGNFSMNNGRGNIYRMETKYYYATLENQYNLVSHFTSIKFYSTNNKYESTYLLERDIDEPFSFDIEQKIIGVIPTMGVNYVFKNHFFVETSFGLGFRRITTINDYSKHGSSYMPCWHGLYSDLEQNRTITTTRLNLNFKVGVSF